MSVKQFLNRYIKRGNFLEDFTPIDHQAQKGGFNHRYTNKDTNGNESDLLLSEKVEIHGGLGLFAIEVLNERQKLGEEIKSDEAKAEIPEFESLEGLQSLSEFHHSGGELFEGMPVLLERNRRTPLKEGILKSWVIGSVKMDLTGYGKYSASSIAVEVDGEVKEWPFLMVYYKRA